MSNDGTATNNNTELLNQLGLSAEDLAAFKADQEAKRVESKRKELLKEFLEKDANSVVYKELYDKYGLKEMVDADPGILDNKTLFLRAAGLAKKDWEKKKQEEEQAKAAAAKPADTAVPSDQSKGSVANGQKVFDKGSMDVFHPEYLDKLDKNSAQYAFFKMNAPKQNEKWR